MSAMASQITNLTNVYSTVHSVAHQRKHQSSASLAFVRGIHRGPVNSPHKWPVTRKMFPFDDVIMITGILFPSQMACNVESVLMSWRHHVWPCVYPVTTASHPIDRNLIDNLTQDSTIRVPSMATHIHISQRYLRMLLFVNKNLLRRLYLLGKLTRPHKISRQFEMYSPLFIAAIENFKKSTQQYGHFHHEKEGSFFFHYEKEIPLWIKGTIVHFFFTMIRWCLYFYSLPKFYHRGMFWDSVGLLHSVVL